MSHQKENHKEENANAVNSQPCHKSSCGTGACEQEGSDADFLPYKGALWFWRGVGAQVNDNHHEPRINTKARSSVLAVAIFLSCLFSVNNSSVMTQAVLHADGAILSTAMDIHPDAVAYMLNSIDVGEVD